MAFTPAAPVEAMMTAALGGAALSTLMAPKPNIQTPQAAPTPPVPQAAQAPNVQGVAKALQGAGQGGGAPGVAQTFLTGPGGINPDLLKLGKSTLLGGGAPAAGPTGGL